MGCPILARSLRKGGIAVPLKALSAHALDP
jgi:hypothetical protein